MLKVVLTFVSIALFFNVRAGQVDTLHVFSNSMQKSIGCLVIKPDGYTAANDPYPVVYLLHGYSGNFTGWLKEAPQLQRLVDLYQILIVCPDGGYDSWYLDSPIDSTVRYETHIVREVIPYIDSTYHTRATRSGRAIAGLSMGGHGALYLGARNPAIFGAAGSMAGGLDLRPFPKNWNLKRVLGDPETSRGNWERHSVVNLVSAFKSTETRLIIDCGISDFFLEVNRDMHQRLLKAGVPHEYTERPGGHTGRYWGSAVDFQLLFFSKAFQE
ncbi:MAG: alpha/beta hydrolase family protein [Saprospiraceae bacterium]|nr:esterase family protein [Lewinellaceae bacterium]